MIEIAKKIKIKQKRLHLARELSELSKNVEYSDFTNVVIPSITQLSNDNESVIRQSLIEQLPELTSQLIKVFFLSYFLSHLIIIN